MRLKCAIKITSHPVRFLKFLAFNLLIPESANKHEIKIQATNITLDAGLPARSQYPEGPATGHLNTGFSWFSCVYKQMLRRFPTFQVATTCFSCSPPDLNLLVTNFIFRIHVK